MVVLTATICGVGGAEENPKPTGGKCTPRTIRQATGPIAFSCTSRTPAVVSRPAMALVKASRRVCIT